MAFAEGGRARRALIVATVMTATIMQAVDMTIANVALPTMQGSLLTTQDRISWVLTSYIVASAIFMPPTGFLAGRFGRKRLLAVAVAGFTVASMLCGVAGSLEEIVLYRLAQGACGAFLVPLSQAVMLDTYPREQHGQAMAIWSSGVMIGPIVGPTLGGWLTEFYDWRWVFFINLPFGAAALAGVLAVVPETPRDRRRRLDRFGFLLLALAVGAFQLMLDRGEIEDWFESPEIVLEAGVAAAAFFMFVVHTATAPRRPFVDPRLFADRNFLAGLALVAAFGALLLTGLALLPPFLQHLADYPPLAVGVVLAPRGAGAMAAMLLVSQISKSVDLRLIALAGLGLIAWSMWEMAGFDAGVDMFALIWTGVVQGFGLGMFFVPLNVIAFATLDDRRRTEAAGIFNLARNLGSSIAIAVLVALVTRYTRINRAELGVHVTAFDAAGLPESWSSASAAGLALLDAEMLRQAGAIAYVNDFKLMTLVALAAMPLLLIVRLPRRR